jgi:hypothetical protein
MGHGTILLHIAPPSAVGVVFSAEANHTESANSLEVAVLPKKCSYYSYIKSYNGKIGADSN